MSSKYSWGSLSKEKPENGQKEEKTQHESEEEQIERGKQKRPVTTFNPSRDPNCMQSNKAGQRPKSGSLYCEELLPAADGRNVCVCVEQLHRIDSLLSCRFNRYKSEGSGSQRMNRTNEIIHHMKTDKSRLWTYFHGYFGRSSPLSQTMTDS